MSYRQPQDPYIHSNASQYDERYQPGAYRDEYPPQQQQTGGYQYDDSQHPMFANAPADQGAAAGSYGAYKEASSPYADSYGGNGGYAAAATNANAQKYSYAPPAKKGLSKWVKIGVPLLLLLIAGGVVGGIFGARAARDNSSSSGSGDSKTSTSTWTGSSSGNAPPTAENSVLQSATAAAKQGGVDDIAYVGTDIYGNPSFKANANTGAPSASGTAAGNCASDSFSGSFDNLRSHPRIMTTKEQWDCLPAKIANDAYLTLWNATIFTNATTYFGMDPVQYVEDGGLTGSGILDPARELQLRVKTYAYAYKISQDTKWRDKLYTELTSAINWKTWNPNHFLDLAEITAAFAIGYDWLYDAWSAQQRSTLRNAIVNNGLTFGVNAYTGANNGAAYGWWRTTNGNWNCVCNSGLLLGALAIADEDNTGTARQILGSVPDNMKGNCMQGALSDGSWSETPNYWYFGTNAQARALSALVTATGSDQGLMASNSNWAKTGLYHMYVSGNAGMFFYGDNGPNKYATTANGMFLWGRSEFGGDGNPRYALFQRDRSDAADPLSMFWYDTRSKGAFWNGLALDERFSDPLANWISMRSSWTDFTGTFVGLKASALKGHQAHGDLDAGTFVIDALGTRWAGELGNGNYLSQDYFTSEEQNATRWTYYRKGTQGQNTLVINNRNQQVDNTPSSNDKFESSGTTQSGDVGFKPSSTDTAYFVTDISSAYGLDANTVRRGIRMLNGRRQVLVQDDIAASSSIQNIAWRVHTNASVALSDDKRTATLTIKNATDPNAYGGNDFGGKPTLTYNFEPKTMVVKILSPAGATFDVMTATPIYNENIVAQPAGQDGNQPNVNVNVLSISLNGGSAQSIQVVWQPQWADMGAADSADPKQVSLDSWSLTSHN